MKQNAWIELSWKQFLKQNEFSPIYLIYYDAVWPANYLISFYLLY